MVLTHQLVRILVARLRRRKGPAHVSSGHLRGPQAAAEQVTRREQGRAVRLCHSGRRARGHSGSGSADLHGVALAEFFFRIPELLLQLPDLISHLLVLFLVVCDDLLLRVEALLQLSQLLLHPVLNLGLVGLNRFAFKPELPQLFQNSVVAAASGGLRSGQLHLRLRLLLRHGPVELELLDLQRQWRFRYRVFGVRPGSGGVAGLIRRRNLLLVPQRFLQLPYEKQDLVYRLVSLK